MTILNAINVRKTFKIPGGKPIKVLKGVDFAVESGEKVAVIGRSGAGKSTLLHILGGLLKPTSGSLSRPDNFGFVFQSYHLMPELTVIENVLLPTMGARARRWMKPGCDFRKRAMELVEKVGLAGRAEHLPAALSGGERQRVALALALVTDPALVLADEPTGNRDAMTGADILRILADLSGEGTALVMVTHSPEAASVCDRTVILEDGILKRQDGQPKPEQVQEAK